MRRAAVVVAGVSILMAAPLFGGDGKTGLGACVLVSAGSGTEAKSERVTQFWEAVNGEIARTLVQELTKGGVDARLALVPHGTAPDKVPGLIALALRREQCGLLMQVTHQLGGGSGPDAYFAFDAALFGIQAEGGGFTVGHQSFRKNYRYAMTDEVLRTLSPAGVAGQLKADLDSAGVLGAQAKK